jgi:hypothetical protein
MSVPITVESGAVYPRHPVRRPTYPRHPDRGAESSQRPYLTVSDAAHLPTVALTDLLNRTWQARTGLSPNSQSCLR